jgi:hypothetical protein
MKSQMIKFFAFMLFQLAAYAAESECVTPREVFIDQLRNKVRFAFLCMAYNLKRGVNLRREINQPQENYV